MTDRHLLVHRAGPSTTVQDLGRTGFAQLGVPRSGAADRGSLRLANRLVGNGEGAAGLEVTVGGLVVTPTAPVLIAVTGAHCPVLVAGRRCGRDAVLEVPAGARVELGVAASGLRGYLAVRGGLAVPAVLGSRSTDTLAGLGPAPLADGDLLPVGDPDGPDVEGWPLLDVVPVPDPPWSSRSPWPSGRPDAVVPLPATLGPRADWFTAAALQRLWTATWTVSPDCDRIGLRLLDPDAAPAGPPPWGRRDPAELAGLPGGPVDGELPSEPLVRGAVQVPPSGLPVIFLSGHPVTGGYPVVAVLGERAADHAAQLAPGRRVRLVGPSRSGGSRVSRTDQGRNP